MVQNYLPGMKSVLELEVVYCLALAEGMYEMGRKIKEHRAESDCTAVFECSLTEIGNFCWALLDSEIADGPQRLEEASAFRNLKSRA